MIGSSFRTKEGVVSLAFLLAPSEENNVSRPNRTATLIKLRKEKETNKKKPPLVKWMLHCTAQML